MNRIIIATLALALAGTVGSAVAGDAAAGKARFATCAGCHGPTGAGNPPTYPAIKGQTAEYVATQLKAFKAGSRQNPTMQAMVAALSEADMENLGAYIATLQ